MKKNFITIPVTLMVLLTSCSARNEEAITDDGRTILTLAYMSMDSDT